MRISHLIGAALLLAGPNASAEIAVIHKWVDGDGVTHYADAAPPDSATPVERIELPSATTPATADAADDYYSIANQWRRMHEERIAIERVRAEREHARAGRGAPQIIQVEINASERRLAVVTRRASSRLRPDPRPRRHPQALPGRDWPVGLHPGRLEPRGGFDPP